MATIATAIIGERWLDEVILAATKANVGADVNDEFTLPAGLGDVAIMQILIQVTSEATAVTTAELGVQARVRDASTGTVDIVGDGRFLRDAAASHVASIDPDALCLWRQNETCNLIYPELDSNVAPTDDHVIYFKTVRVRPIEGAPGPIQLVR